jgi:organic hydroperoxide reductase OsmC/OhrA
MMGTLAAVLAGRKIRTGEDVYRADVEGDIRDVGGVLRITDIRVRYTLKIPAEKEDDARWSLDNYLEKCPAAQSVMGCISITHELVTEKT